MDSDILLTTETAHVLGVAATTVYDLERRGVLRASRTSRGVRLFRRDEVERLAATRREAAARAATVSTAR